jgi:hypothetical protein
MFNLIGIIIDKHIEDLRVLSCMIEYCIHSYGSNKLYHDNIYYRSSNFNSYYINFNIPMTGNEILISKYISNIIFLCFKIIIQIALLVFFQYITTQPQVA